MQCLLRMNVYPFRSERSFDPALLATANTVPCVSSANLTLGITSRLPVNWELAEQWILTSLLPNTNCQLDPRTRSFLIADDSFLIAGMRVTEFLPALFPS